MKITKRPPCKFYESQLEVEWFDRYRGPMHQTMTFDEAAKTLGVSIRTIHHYLKNGFSESDQLLIAVYCCGRMDQFDNSWAGFVVRGNKLLTPLGKELSPSELEQYAFQMDLAIAYKVELRKIQEQNRYYRRLLDHYGSDKIVEFPFNEKDKSTA